jgi:hypothetical protein
VLDERRLRVEEVSSGVRRSGTCGAIPIRFESM